MVKEIDWKCGKCGKGYTFEELMLLDKVKSEWKDNNKKQHGLIPSCSCGYRFGLDKMRMRTKVSLNLDSVGEISGEVSTVFLELNHSGLFYETMVFLETYSCEFQVRYKNKADAKKGHSKIVQAIKNKEYTVDDKEEEIILSDVLCEGSETGGKNGNSK